MNVFEEAYRKMLELDVVQEKLYWAHRADYAANGALFDMDLYLKWEMAFTDYNLALEEWLRHN